MMVWTEERVSQLTKLWDDGLPATDIAAQMGVSRNAVIGKAHRLGLPKRTRPASVAAAARPKVETAKERARSAQPTPKPDTGEEEKTKPATGDAEQSETPEELPVAEARSLGEIEADIIANTREAEQTSPRLSLMELTGKTCKWPVGDPATEDFWFCGHPSVPGKPYCAPHNALASQPITSRRDRRGGRKPPYPMKRPD